MGESEEGTQFVIILSNPAQRVLKRMNQSDKNLAIRISQALDNIKNDPYSHKLIVGRKKRARAARAGDYRIIYKIHKDEVFVESIKHRKEAYRG